MQTVYLFFKNYALYFMLRFVIFTFFQFKKGRIENKKNQI